MVISGSNFFDKILILHLLVDFEPSEIIVGGMDVYLSELPRASHKDLAVSIEYGCVTPRRGDFQGQPSESSDGRGLYGKFAGVYGEFSVLVPAPRIDQGDSIALGSGSVWADSR